MKKKTKRRIILVTLVLLTIIIFSFNSIINKCTYYIQTHDLEHKLEDSRYEVISIKKYKIMGGTFVPKSINLSIDWQEYTISYTNNRYDNNYVKMYFYRDDENRIICRSDNYLYGETITVYDEKFSVAKFKRIISDYDFRYYIPFLGKMDKLDDKYELIINKSFINKRVYDHLELDQMHSKVRTIIISYKFLEENSYSWSIFVWDDTLAYKNYYVSASVKYYDEMPQS